MSRSCLAFSKEKRKKRRHGWDTYAEVSWKWVFNTSTTLQIKCLYFLAKWLIYIYEDFWLKSFKGTGSLIMSCRSMTWLMVAKILDLSMTRIFCEKQNAANTRRVVGTLHAYLHFFIHLDWQFSFIEFQRRNNHFYKTLLFKQLTGMHGDYGMKEKIWKLWTLYWWNHARHPKSKDAIKSDFCACKKILQTGLPCPLWWLFYEVNQWNFHHQDSLRFLLVKWFQVVSLQQLLL